jgi:MFS family permease
MATTNGLVLHILPGRVLLIFAATAKMLAVLFFALMPDEPSYWAWILPAMVAEAVCAGVLWTVSNVYLTTCLPRHRQGLAGALVTVTLFMGGAMFLAVANVARGQFVKAGFDLKEQYKGVFWTGFGVATIALVLCVFVKLGKAGCTLTVDEMAVKQEEEEDAIEQVSSSQDSHISIQWVEGVEKDEVVVGVAEDTPSGGEESGGAVEHRAHETS